METKVLQFWDEEQIFQKLVERNSESRKRYAFLDGPITANNPMGLHHAWGRSVKDLIQRYWSMKGYATRFQNGFDCQGLWIEVEVEKNLGLNSKKAIEDYGLENFSEKCKERIKKYSTILTEESKRLGQWMHWDNSYYTHTDTNISYIWYFLKTCYDKGWIIKDHLPMPWCTRCGTSLSQHEQHDAYEQLTHTATYVKFPLITTAENEFLLVWTTTPWTLTANTAVAVNPELIYCKVKQDGNYYYLVKDKLSILKQDFEMVDEFLGDKLLGKEYKSPFGYLEAQKEITHRIIQWNDVSSEEGTGLVHIAPGCGAEDFELSKTNDLAILSPIDESGFFYKEYDQLQGLYVNEASIKAIEILTQMNLLYKKEQYTHRYPTCWRCHEELVFRLVEEFFIDSKEIKPQLLEAIKSVEWVPNFYEKRMEDWLNNMGNWCISRKRYWGLPLPFFDCQKCGTLTVIGSKDELYEKSVADLSNLKELHRPWIDSVKIKCSKCNEVVEKVTEVGDCWLDAGIVPFSTQQYFEDPNYWKQWFPIDSVCEMREQIRLWFYSLLFMSVALVGKAPYKRVIVHEKVHDKDGKPMHRSWGNAIWFKEAVSKLGADVIRWSFMRHPLTHVMNFGYYLEKELKPFFLTIWNVYSFFATFANLDEFTPLEKLDSKFEKPVFDQWLLSLVNQLVKKVKSNLDNSRFHLATQEIEQFVETLSTWYLRRNRRRFWSKKRTQNKLSAYHTLYTTLVTLVKLLAPFVPFFSEYLYQCLTANVNTKMPLSIHLNKYPRVSRKAINQELNYQMETVLSVVKLGRAARNKSNIRLRQPLAELLVWCKDSSHETTLRQFRKEIISELNVKKLKIVKKPERFLTLHLKPNYPILGPKLKNDIQIVRAKIQQLPQKELLEVYHTKEQLLTLNLENRKEPLKLKFNHDLLLEAKEKGKHVIAINESFAVALNTKITEELELEGIARDVVRAIQNLRKENDLDVSAKIKVKFEAQNKTKDALEKYKEYIMNETLAIDLKESNLSENTEAISIQDALILLENNNDKP